MSYLTPFQLYILSIARNEMEVFKNVQEKDPRSNFSGNHRIADPILKAQRLNSGFPIWGGRYLFMLLNQIKIQEE